MGLPKDGGRYAPPPCSAQVIPRDRLFARLAARPTVVVMGTAGYGKSMLISSWLVQSPPEGAVAWLTLDPSDCDPGRLAADLLAALQTTASGRLGESFRNLEAPPVFADRFSFVDSIHEALFDAEVPLTLVLDDVHQVSTSSSALELLDHFMLWAPSFTRVILASRSIPGLRLQRLRLEDRLELVGPEDLAFTPEETSAVVRIWGLDPSSETVEELHQLTHGWPAGVRMALLAKGAGALGNLPAELREDDALAEYLTTEVLSSLDPETRQFVVEATIDERVCPSLLDVVRGSDQSITLLGQCVRQGLFLTREPATDNGQWFRWHSLFAAHMRPRRRIRAARSDELERRAARWWRNADPAIAVTHALAAHDGELAGEIASQAWLGLTLAGRGSTAGRIADEVPAEVTQAAELHLARAFVAAERGSIDVAGVELNEARQVSSRLDEASRAGFEIRATMIELFVVRDRAALSESLAHGRKLMTEAESASWGIDRATVALVKLCVGMGEARLLDNPLEAVRLLQEAESTARDAGYGALEIVAQAEQCIPLVATGRVEDIRLLAEHVLAKAKAKGWGDLPSVAIVYGWLGWLAMCRGDPREARELLERCIANLSPYDWGMLGLTTTHHAQACIGVGDFEAAENDARRGRELATHGRMPPWWPSLLTAIEATLLAATGRIDEGLARLEEPTAGPEYYLATCYKANVLLRGGRPDRTIEVLETFPANRMYPHVAGLVDGLRAQALLETGDRTGAHVALERALASAHKYSFVGPFVMIGNRISPLLDEHLTEGTSHPDFVVQVRNRLAAPPSQEVNEWGEKLTQREQSILRYLATDLSHAEIAEAEFISVNTVKTHTAHVYQKLGVVNRRAAVRRSAELGLL